MAFVRNLRPRGRDHARTVRTPHGVIDTPAFMPVGTRMPQGPVAPPDARHRHADRPGQHVSPAAAARRRNRRASRRAARFMNWHGPCSPTAAVFRSFRSPTCAARRRRRHLPFAHRRRASSASRRRCSIAVQNQLGADIIMALRRMPAARGDAGQRGRRPM